jgi:hypothetical protein
MPRRIYTFHAGLGWGWQNLWVTVGAYVFALGVGVFIANVFYSLRRGAAAGPDPWGAPTLEWSTPSPPPPYNFARIPVVASRHPLWEDERPARSVPHSRLEGLPLDVGRDTLGTSPLGAQPDEILRMPQDTLWPFFLSLALLATSYGLLVALWWLAAAGVVGLVVTSVGWLWPAASPARARG